MFLRIIEFNYLTLYVLLLSKSSILITDTIFYATNTQIKNIKNKFHTSKLFFIKFDTSINFYAILVYYEYQNNKIKHTLQN